MSKKLNNNVFHNLDENSIISGFASKHVPTEFYNESTGKYNSNNIYNAGLENLTNGSWPSIINVLDIDWNDVSVKYFGDGINN